MQNLRNRSFLTLLDFSQKEVEFLLNLSEDLKRAKYAGIEQQKLKGKNIALIFEKDSTRTRCAFETAAYDQGAHVTYLGPTGSQMGKKESAKDTARVLGGMYDGIEYRGFSQRTVEELAKYSGVPVWNGLTDEDHPTQVLADFLTAKEVLKKPYHEINFTYVGDGRNNVANALMQGAAIMGMTFHLVCPKELNPTDELLNRCKEIAAKNGGEILVTDNIDEGVKGSDVIYTDVWVSMGEPDEVWEQRIKLLEPYRVTKEMMEKTGNPRAIFEHCLPSFHDTETKIGKEIQEKYGLTEMEVADEVFESEQSVVFQEAENRAHTIKAVMVATLGE
ncbi:MULTISPECIES: ornithine carbamoyltransferase [unclassified Staphylococcus]|uniref:ornithine carbamoyltransferase n=1 Tax=unclassified Staphylococcus TaxID=91994 RepID=UPI0018819FFE|nr:MULTISPECIES: ornithine carbamoyltransferase [unclassified Staphylococcus]MBF2756499.1 ornithine carbamoyltransferase [Staphylococcus haemolyticus]MBF2773747.1 ornithine carbamoyltransferase [Staphylococcus haemolyticus]MBF2775863.1 ornithine carbamoyltransferase [Staphylococcus haemolyticus]MBF2815432.1 ornithine carbamoyltransferase [Staphylococcus haemolyticus]MBF9719794.1 ornithine carbamoyltransferase [Staphylococcus haemolyticus]